MSRLARVLDPDALDASAGPRAKLAIDVPSDWSGDIRIVAPVRLICARCDGGGCDGCERSGALRLEHDAARRTLSLTLPADRGAGAIVRIAQPFGPDAAPEQLLLELRTTEAPSPNIGLVGPAPEPPERALRLSQIPRATLVSVAVALAAIAAIIALTR